MNDVDRKIDVQSLWRKMIENALCEEAGLTDKQLVVFFATCAGHSPSVIARATGTKRQVAQGKRALAFKHILRVSGLNTDKVNWRALQ